MFVGQIIYSIQESPDDGQYHYAQRMCVRTYHEEERKKVDVGIHEDERIELYVPMRFDSSSDLKVFMDERSRLPFLGEYLPIQVIEDSDSREVFVQNGAIHMKAGLSAGGIRASLLKLCRNKAYEYFKLKVDHY